MGMRFSILLKMMLPSPAKCWLPIEILPRSCQAEAVDSFFFKLIRHRLVWRVNSQPDSTLLTRSSQRPSRPLIVDPDPFLRLPPLREKLTTIDLRSRKTSSDNLFFKNSILPDMSDKDAGTPRLFLIRHGKGIPIQSCIHYNVE